MDDWMRLEDVDLASVDPPEDLGPTPGDPSGRWAQAVYIKSLAINSTG